MSNFTGLFTPKENAKELIDSSFEDLLDFGSIHVTDDVQKADLDETSIYLFGNIYNSELKTDTADKILRNFLKSGKEYFRTLDGEFTLFIQNKIETIIFRDRHGAGPQVYYNSKIFTAFLKNFLSIKNFEPKANLEALFTFLSIGYVPSPMCSLEGINKLPAGNLLTTNKIEQQLENLYPWETYIKACKNPSDLSEKEATEKYKELHQKAIKMRVSGKKKVGLLLSGGYDSGGNIAGLREVYSGDAFSYSVGFKDNPWTELPLAKILSEKFGTQHAEYEIDGSEIKELPEIIEFLGDPFQEGGLMVNYAAMKLIGDDKP